MKIVWTEPAEADLDEIFDYIARDAPVYAERFLARIIDAVTMLIAHPQIGRPVPEAEREDVREIIYQGYRIVYLARQEQLYILTVFHGSRDLAGTQPKPWDVG
jgi:addiction module RelE/StbE family toxin